MIETEIKGALTRLLAAIKSADSQSVAAEMTALDALVTRAGPALHPQLMHFLRNRSYAKAAMFLGGESDIPAGNCGGRSAGS